MRGGNRRVAVASRWLGCALLAASLPAWAAAAVPKLLAGTWEIKRVIPTSNISAGPLPDAVGRRFRYAASQARLNGRVVRRPIYRLQELSAADLLRDYRVPAAELGLTGSIRLFRVLTIRGRAETPVLELGATVLADPVGRLIAMWDGQFYELQRVR